MSGVEDVIVDLSAVATPTGANTVTLFNSFTAFKGVPLSVCGLHRLSFTSKNDQGYTLKLFRLDRTGANPDQVGGNIVFGASVAGDLNGPTDLLIDGFEHCRLDVLNGGVDQGTWRPTLTLLGDRARGN